MSNWDDYEEREGEYLAGKNQAWEEMLGIAAENIGRRELTVKCAQAIARNLGCGPLEKCKGGCDLSIDEHVTGDKEFGCMWLAEQIVNELFPKDQ